MANFLDRLQRAIGSQVEVRWRGQGAATGRLAGVGIDFLTLIGAGGDPVYVALEQVRCVIEPACASRADAAAPGAAASLREVLEAHKGRHVTLDDGERGDATGFIFQVQDDYVTLLADNSLIRFRLQHLASMTPVVCAAAAPQPAEAAGAPEPAAETPPGAPTPEPDEVQPPVEQPPAPPPRTIVAFGSDSSGSERPRRPSRAGKRRR